MLSSISAAGRNKLAVHAFLLLLDIIALVFAVRVNVFQEYFFMADLLPLGLSATTLVIFTLLIIVDISCTNAFTSRPLFQIGILYVLSIFWLAFNAFSTSRWRNIPFNCSSIPVEYPDERVWCQDVQALKSLVWILFVGILLTASFTLRFAIVQCQRGNRHVWRTSICRFDPQSARRHDLRATMTDYFARGSPEISTKW